MSTARDRSELPIPDFDHMPEGALAQRIRSLSEEDVRRVLEYEHEHANRLAVTLVLERRISALRAGQATQSAGDPATTSGQSPPAAGDSRFRGHGGVDQTQDRDTRAS